jgi:regulatory protein
VTDAAPFKDAEAWLAARGVTREPIHLAPDPQPLSPPDPAADAGSAPDVSEGEGATPAPVTARDVRRLAAQADADAGQRAGDADALPDPAVTGLDDDVARAMAFVRSSTAAAPQSEGRIRQKLADRGLPGAVIEATLERARRERLVDDQAMAAALIAERRAKGHAVARIRRDLRDRGFDDDVLRTALGGLESEDQEAAAFAVARDKAAGLTGVTAETAFRRVTGYVARRGYPESLARKVAREAVFTARDAERTAGH